MEDLKLNNTQLLFVPGLSEDDKPTVVQVTVQSETKLVSFETLAAYHLAQPNLSKLILLTLIHHKSVPLSTPATFIGEGFTLVATHRPWPYGNRWSFKWGEESIPPSQEKWTFEFRPLIGGTDNERI